MPLYLDTTGKATLGIGICARCSRKFSLTELHDDPNTSLKVCKADLDVLDPYRLPPLQPDDIVLPFARPDEPLDGTSTAPATSGLVWYGVRVPWVVGGWL